MRYLRNTMFPPPEIGPPATFVTAETDLRVPIEVAANQMRSHPGPPPPSDVDVEIFEFEGSLIEATAEAHRRAQSRIPEKKRNTDLLHDWCIAMLYQMPPKKAIISDARAPLNVEEIKNVLLEVTKHPQYKGGRDHTLVLTADDGRHVILELGRVIVRD
jgi:hypothetical protein